MKKHLLVELVLIIILLGIGFWNVKQQQETISLREETDILKEEQKSLLEEKEELFSENERLSDQAVASSESLKKFQQECTNKEITIDLNAEFTDVVTKLFEANLNFTPENFDERKKEVSNYLSEELSKEYFGQKRNTYQDANDTLSKLESLYIYFNGSQSKNSEGLIVVHYKNKKNGQEWRKARNIFKIKYNRESKKVIEIVNLGSFHSTELKE